MTSDQSRYGIYFAPAKNTGLWRKAGIWLGRDAETGELLGHPSFPDLSAPDIQQATATPRRYGFHATLKPPFHLAEGRSETALFQALQSFCLTRQPFDAPALEIRSLGRFVALQLSRQSPLMDRLAADCVRAFDVFRAPASATELAKRRSKSLSDRQLKMLEQWGYPYVMDEFHFHMTLTDALPGDMRVVCEQVLRDYFADTCPGPLHIEALTLFKQPTNDAPFHVVRRFPFFGVKTNTSKAVS